MTWRRPCWCLWTKKEQPCWFLKLILRELNSILMQTICFGLILRQTPTLCKIHCNLSYRFLTIIFFPTILYPLCFEDSILLFSFHVFSLSLLSLLFVGLYVVSPNNVSAAMLMSLNKEIAAKLVPQTNPSRIELYVYANNLFWFGFKTKG